MTPVNDHPMVNAAPTPSSETPQEEPTPTKHARGLYNKFTVTRTDGASAAGRKHHGCEYFVLDMIHDPFATAAIRAYAAACEGEYPILARDLRDKTPVLSPESPAVAPSDAPDERLRKLALAATPGPWRNDFEKEQDHSNASYVTSLPLEDTSDAADVMKFAVVGSIWHDGPCTVITKENAAYIAACSPDVILALLSERDHWKHAFENVAESTQVRILAELTAERDSLRSEIAALREDAAKATRVHLARHTRLSEAVGLDPGYSADGTVDEAIRQLAALREDKARLAKVVAICNKTPRNVSMLRQGLAYEAVCDALDAARSEKPTP